MESNAATAVSHLKAYLARTAPIPDAELSEFLEKHVTRGTYPQGSFFTRVGDTTDRVGFVVEGLFRVYYTAQDGRRHVRNFCTAGTPLGAYASILSNQPANAFIEALEDSVVLEFSFARLAAQFTRSIAWDCLGRRMAEDHYISRERREHALLTLDASDRLERFYEDFPGLASRLSAADIASYVGVRPETLSRLRRQRLARPRARQSP